MGNKLIIAILASLAFVSSAFADHHEDGEKKPFSISGDFAGSLQFYGNELGPNDPTAPTANTNPNHDEFNINLIEINLEKNWSKSSLNLSIGYGSTAQTVNDLTTASRNTLNVMNAYYTMNTSYGLTFMFGKWEAPFGIEHYNHVENAQYTRSYGFDLTPYFQTGAAVNYNGGMWDAGFIVSNGQGTDTDRNDDNKTMAVTLGANPMDNLALDLNYITGTESNGTLEAQLNTLDFSAAYMINEMFDVALNYVQMNTKSTAANSEDETATSIAAYVNANFGMFGLGLRYEQFSYDDASVLANLFAANPGVGTKQENTISAITLAAKAEIDQNANVILEYRTDSSDEQIWTDKDGNATDSTDVITLGLMYTF